MFSFEGFGFSCSVDISEIRFLIKKDINIF
jgi:hypothetical protein